MDALFIAVSRFDPSDGQRWTDYCQWSKIPALAEIVSLDTLLCPRLLTEIDDADWAHIVNDDCRLAYFYHLDYLLQRVAGLPRRNILGLYRNPTQHIAAPPAAGPFFFMGYDLVEEMTQISALTNCGGFHETFANDELNRVGLIHNFARASEIQRSLRQNNPDEPHAQCELYAIWRLDEI